MKWNHILDKQPEHGKFIIQIDPPYEGHFNIGMREYIQYCSFEDVLNYSKSNDIPTPDYWWVYVRDFDFPNDPSFSFLL